MKCLQKYRSLILLLVLPALVACSKKSEDKEARSVLSQISKPLISDPNLFETTLKKSSSVHQYSKLPFSHILMGVTFDEFEKKKVEQGLHAEYNAMLAGIYNYSVYDVSLPAYDFQKKGFQIEPYSRDIEFDCDCRLGMFNAISAKLTEPVVFGFLSVDESEAENLTKNLRGRYRYGDLKGVLLFKFTGAVMTEEKKSGNFTYETKKPYIEPLGLRIELQAGKYIYGNIKSD